jgi:hypothetical protein
MKVVPEFSNWGKFFTINLIFHECVRKEKNTIIITFLWHHNRIIVRLNLKNMYDSKEHKTEHRIVSIHQPWILPDCPRQDRALSGERNAAEDEFGIPIHPDLTY